MAPVVKNLPANVGDVRDLSLILGSGRSLAEGNGIHSSILAPRHAHGDLTSLAPHERLPEILVVPRGVAELVMTEST